MTGFPSLRRYRLLGLLLLAASGTTLLALRAGAWLVTSMPIDQPDAIVVLASHEWERLPAAARLALRYPRARVLLTQPGTVNDTTCFQCGDRPWQLVDRGVSADRITLLPVPSGNTYQEALSALDFSQATSVRRVLVVTSPYHARRALATFRSVFRGSDIGVGLQTSLEESNARPDTWWAHHEDRRYVAYEIAASIAYWFKYRIPTVFSVSLQHAAGYP